jgi:8-oxo-dGTP pyrophosphatase MutT (NUDIX family)
VGERLTAPVRHVVTVGVLVRAGRVLLCHRHPDRRWYPGVWDLPGGHVEAGEEAAGALRRELREELGVGAGTLEPIARLMAHDLDQTVLRVVSWDGEPTNREPAEHDAIVWFTADELVGLDLALPEYLALLTTALRTTPPRD